MAVYRGLVAALLVLGVGACGGPSGSPCPHRGEPGRANAGCLAVLDGRMLVIEQRDGRRSVPGGTADPGEAPRCTAYRETFEETGVPVEVGRLLHTFDNGFQVYHCRPRGDGRPRVSRFNPEVRGAYWMALDELPEERWRIPGQLVLLRDLAEEAAGTWE